MPKLFTEEEQAILRANPYTLCVSADKIKYTIEFKRFILNEVQKPGVTHTRAFRNAGYDPDILGEGRIRASVKAFRREAASPKGLHETGPSKDTLAKKDLEKKHTKTAIKDLQHEVIKLQQEIEFLKKILQLPYEDDTTP